MHCGTAPRRVVVSFRPAKQTTGLAYTATLFLARACRPRAPHLHLLYSFFFAHRSNVRPFSRNRLGADEQVSNGDSEVTTVTRALKARLRRAAGELRDGLVCGTRQVLVERVVRAGRCASLGGRQTTANGDNDANTRA